MTFGGDYGYKDGAESMILSVRTESIILSAGMLLTPIPPCCHCCCLCLRRGSSGGSMGIAVCRRRGGDVATTDVDFVLVFVLVFVFVAPCRWGRDVPPLPGCGYWHDRLVCCRSRPPWRHHPRSRDKDGTNKDDRGNNE